MSHGICEEGLACNKPYNPADYPGVCVKSKLHFYTSDFPVLIKVRNNLNKKGILYPLYFSDR